MSERTIEGALFERKTEKLTPAELATYALQLQLEINSMGTTQDELEELGHEGVQQLDGLCDYGGKEVEISGSVLLSELDPESERVSISLQRVESLRGISQGFGFMIQPVFIEGQELPEQCRLQFTHMVQVSSEPRVHFMPYVRIESMALSNAPVEECSLEVVDETGVPDTHTLEALYSGEMEEIDDVILNTANELEATTELAKEIAPKLVGADEDMLRRITRYLNSEIIFKKHTPAFVAGAELLYSLSFNDDDEAEFRPLRWKDGYFAYLEQFTLMPATQTIKGVNVQDPSRQQLAMKLDIISDEDERVSFVIPLNADLKLRPIS